MTNGNQNILANGKRRISPITGKRVLSTAGPCCCCAYTACGTSSIFCDCQATPGITVDAVCCERNTGTVSITFPTFARATGWESQPFADAFDDFMNEVSGQTLTFGLNGINRGYRFFKYGKVSQKSTDGCIAYAWQIDVFSYYDEGTSDDMMFDIEITIVGSDTNGPWNLGDNFPCTDSNGNPTGAFNPAGTPLQLVSMSADAPGNCYGPTENLVLDLVDPSYIEPDDYEVEPWTISSDCGPEDNSGFPASFDIDLDQFFSGLPTVTINKNTPSGLVDLYYGGSDGGTVGVYRWDLIGLELVPQGHAQAPGEDCDINVACCFRVFGLLLVYDETNPGDPILILERFIDGYKCGDAGDIFGTYTEIPELGGGTFDITATP